MDGTNPELNFKKFAELRDDRHARKEKKREMRRTRASQAAGGEALSGNTPLPSQDIDSHMSNLRVASPRAHNSNSNLQSSSMIESFLPHAIDSLTFRESIIPIEETTSTSPNHGGGHKRKKFGPRRRAYVWKNKYEMRETPYPTNAIMYRRTVGQEHKFGMDPWPVCDNKPGLPDIYDDPYNEERYGNWVPAMVRYRCRLRDGEERKHFSRAYKSVPVAEGEVASEDEMEE